MKTVQVNLNERVVLLHRGVPQTALGPGRHRFWRAELSELRFNTDQVLLSAAAEVRALLPAAWFADVLLQAHERALIYRDEKPVAYLRPGAHRYWTLDASVRLRRLDVREAMPSFTAEELALLPRAEVLEATVSAHERGLLLENGRFVQSLLPGLYRFWQTPDIRTQVQTVDMRRRNVTLSGQELMTRDKVTLRVTLSIEYSVVDERRALCATA
jgi:SPFH domain / Band 7 family